MNPPPYIPDNQNSNQNSNQNLNQNHQPLITEQPMPAPVPSAPPAYQTFPEYDPTLLNEPNIKKKSKCRVIIPFPCYDIDITDFPRIRFIPNSVSDGTRKSKKQ
jgi:hypothetical protein